MNVHGPKSLPDGTIRQAGIPLRPSDGTERAPYGLLVRGVVTSTYVLDDPSHPFQAPNVPVAVYCDVLVYSSISGMRFRHLSRVLVLQDRGAMHSGRIWKPRAASIDVTTATMALGKGTNPANVDGDHVLVAFVDNSYSAPIIVGGIPHPIADTGNTQATVGHRRGLKLIDGDPDYWKHKGLFYGIDKDGNFVVDTTKAYAATQFGNDGKEPTPTTNGASGNVVVNLQTGSKLTVKVNGTNTLELDLSGPDAKLKLGDGAMSAIIAEALQTFFNGDNKNWHVAHTHTTAMGESATPTQAATFPTFPAAAISSKVKIPNG